MAVAAVSTLGTYLGWQATTIAIAQIGVGLALSAVARSKQSTALSSGTVGIRSNFTTSGESTPQTFILGRYATRGHVVAPYYSNGESSGIPNAFRYQIIDVGDAPVDSLHQIILGDKVFNWPGDFLSSGLGFNSVNGTVYDGDYEDHLYAIFQDGRQTQALQTLIDRFGDHPERPWTSDHVGYGVPHVVMAYRYREDLYNSEPVPIFVVNGVRLYDWRQDSTNGGTGPQRFDDKTTWTFTENPIVMIYNILRGIGLRDGEVYGLNVEAADLPVDVWTEAADECDARGYKAGYEVPMATLEYGGQTPLDVIDILLMSCAGEVADMGGMWLVRVGNDSLPAEFITDGHISRDHSQSFTPFSPRNEVFNVIRASFVAPDLLWEVQELPLQEDAASVASVGRRLSALTFNAVTDSIQGQELMGEALKTAGRARQNVLTGPPIWGHVRPLDVVQWTSARHGYTSKRMDVAQVTIDSNTLMPSWHLREVNPTNYSPGAFTALVNPSPTKDKITGVQVPGFSVLFNIPVDPDGLQRTGNIVAQWTPDSPGLRHVEYQVRANGTDIVDDGLFPGASGQGTSGVGVKNGYTYEVRVKPVIAGVIGEWSAWTQVITQDIQITSRDIGSSAVLASNMGVSSSDNIHRDFNMVDDDFYTADSGSFTFEPTDVSEGGENLMSLPAGVFSEVRTEWEPITPDADYVAQIAAWMFSNAAGAGTVEVDVEIMFFDTAGPPGIFSIPLASQTDSADRTLHEAKFSTTTTDKRHRFVYRRLAGGSERARISGPRILRGIDRTTLSADATTEVTRIVSGSANENVFPATTTWLTIATLVVDKKTSAPVDLFASFDYSSGQPNTGRFTRNNVLVGSTFAMPGTNNVETSFFRPEADDDTDTGFITYRLQVQANTIANTLTLWPRLLTATHTGT